MQQDVYADLLFLINFSMDYLCLYICAKIMHYKMHGRRMLLASAIGGIYSIISLFLPFSSVISLIIDGLFCIIICAIAFCDSRKKLSSTLVCSFLFVGVSMMTGGCMTAIFNLLNRLQLPLDGIEADGISTYAFAILALVAGIIALKSGELISRRSSITECRLDISIGDKSISINALSDTGNLVKDPLSGKSVIIVDRAEIGRLCDVELFDKFILGERKDSNLPRGMRVIPINTAGGRAMLCACIPDKLTVEVVSSKGKTHTLTPSALIAPSDINKSAEGYSAIIPAEILKI